MDRTFTIHQIESKKRLQKIGAVILVGSGKGGVGKSFVASGLALTLSSKGYRTGILDLDIHGASLLNYLDVSPPVSSGKNGLKPKLVGDLKVMSIALFTANNPVPLRGERKQELVSQLFSLTNWGNIDYLIVDLPPSTGDEVLSAFEIFRDKCSLVLVTTPSPNAVNVVSRLRQLADSEAIPIRGMVVNMAYALQARKRVEIFGKFDPKFLERNLNARLLAEIPLDSSVNFKRLKELLNSTGSVSQAFDKLSHTVIRK